MKITFPYIRTSKDHKVVWSEDTVIELHETYLTIRVDAIEEAPKDSDDLTLGTKESKKSGGSLLLKSHIAAIDSGWDNASQCYDFTIYTTGVVYGYNCSDKGTAILIANELNNWLIQ